MATYILSFRGSTGRTSTAEGDAEWGKWFGELGSQIADQGNRVGRTSTLGQAGSGQDSLTGYILISADDFDAAVAAAGKCPALHQDGGVEVGELVAMG